MPTSLVLGASGGIGGAVADALASRGHDVVRASRKAGDVDLLDEASIASLAARVPKGLHTVFVATGALAIDDTGPERSLRQLDPTVMAKAFAVNAIGPALVAKHFRAHLAPQGRFAFLSARLASIGDNGLGGWTSYRASKAALNQIVRNTAIELGRRHPGAVIVALHPGTVETDLTRPFARGRYTATATECAAQLLGVLDALTPADSGGFFAYDGRPIPW